MTEEQIKQLAEAKLAEISKDERFEVLLTVAQLLYPEDEGYIELYKELRQFTREASRNLLDEGYGPVVQEQDQLDMDSAQQALEDLLKDFK